MTMQYSSQVIHSLAEAAGTTPGHIRQLIKLQVNETVHARLRAAGIIGRTYVPREKYGPCQAHLLVPEYKCSFQSTAFIAGVPVCGIHRDRLFARRKTVLGPCEANSFTDRFDKCECKATRRYKGKPVCVRHFSALNGPLGEMSLRESYKVKSNRFKRDGQYVKCEAHTISDRFPACNNYALSEWNGTPVCGRHQTSLNGKRGTMSKRELWRIKAQEHLARKSHVDLDLAV